MDEIIDSFKPKYAGTCVKMSSLRFYKNKCEIEKKMH